MSKVSIIIPVYNVEPYIIRCLSSVANQSFLDKMECILVDDCGNDKSVCIAEDFIRQYHGKIHFELIHRDKNGGLSAARNTGINNAHGDYIFFLDSDDELPSYAIDKLYSLIIKYPNVEMAQGSFKQVPLMEEGLTFAEDAFPGLIEGNHKIMEYMLNSLPSTCTNRLIKKDLIINHKLYFTENLLHEDELYSYMLSKYLNKIAVSAEQTYIYYTKREGSITTIPDKTKSYISILKIASICLRNMEQENSKTESAYIDLLLSTWRYCNNWPYIKQKSLVRKQQRSTLKTALSTKLYPLVLKHDALQILLPVRFINNRLFIKIHFAINLILKGCFLKYLFSKKQSQLDK